MKLKFPVSKLTELKALMKDNPDAIAVVLTESEFIEINAELVEARDTNSVLMSQRANRQFVSCGHWIDVEIKPWP